MKTTKHVLIVICLTIMPQLLYGMSTTFVSSSSYFPKTQFARKNLTSFDLYITNDSAHSSFDKNGNETTLLSFNGSHDLYNRFVDSSLPYNDTQNMGKAFLSGTYSDINYAFAFTQNIGSNLFISFATSYTQSCIKNFKILPIKSNCFLMTQDEIKAQPGLTEYLKKLNAKLNPASCNLAISETIGGPTFLGFGYCTSLQHFSTIDFLDLTFQVGFLLPEIVLDTPTNNILSAIPPAAIFNIGIPIISSFTVGMYDWLNIGGTFIVMPYIPNDTVIPLNTTMTKNNIFIDQEGLCFVHHKPFIYANAYIESEQLIPYVTLMAGLCYIKQYPSCYHAQDTQKFPDKIINSSPTNPEWSCFNITLEAEYDFSSTDSKRLPRITFVYVRTLFGSAVFKSSTLAGIFGLDLTYDF